MATETPSVAPPRAEVPMVDAEVVRQIRELHRGGWGAKRIARELEVARNTVRRYLRLRTVEAGIQIRPRARQLDAPARAEALRLFDGPAEHNAVVVTVTKIYGERYLAEYSALLDGSAAMRTVRVMVENIADTDATVVLRGESGVGKDLVARAIHAASRRRTGPFIKVNCAAIPSDLLESELFGHEKGAFTGAHRRKLGQFEYANKGTIYLDEIADLPLALQAKLLHVLQDLRFARVGGHGVIDVDIRVVAATNRDLEHALTRGDFREDLYYRLNVVEIRIPPLRERKEEILILAARFLAQFNQQYGRKKQSPPATTARLVEYSWGGNVREMENMIRRMVVLQDGEQAFEHLVVRCRQMEPSAPRSTSLSTEGLRDIARRGSQEAERKALAEVLERVQWNRAEAARLLKVSYKTLLNKIAERRLKPPPSLQFG